MNEVKFRFNTLPTIIVFLLATYFVLYGLDLVETYIRPLLAYWRW